MTSILASAPLIATDCLWRPLRRRNVRWLNGGEPLATLIGWSIVTHYICKTVTVFGQQTSDGPLSSTWSSAATRQIFCLTGIYYILSGCLDSLILPCSLLVFVLLRYLASGYHHGNPKWLAPNNADKILHRTGSDLLSFFKVQFSFSVSVSEKRGFWFHREPYAVWMGTGKIHQTLFNKSSGITR